MSGVPAMLRASAGVRPLGVGVGSLPGVGGAPLLPGQAPSIGFDPACVPLAPISPVRPLWWVEDIGLGNGKNLCPGEEKVIVYAQTRECEFAEPIDVVLSVRDARPAQVTLDPDSFAWARLRAQVEWGVGATSFSALVDLVQGVHFSVVAQELRVTASYDVVIPPWSTDCPDPCLFPEVVVNGGLGYGCNKGTQLTELAMVEKPGDSAFVCIPPWADHFHILTARDASLDARIVGFGGQLFVDVDDPEPNKRIPIPNGARFIQVFNTNDDGAPLFAFVVFALSF